MVFIHTVTAQIALLARMSMHQAEGTLEDLFSMLDTSKGTGHMSTPKRISKLLTEGKHLHTYVDQLCEHGNSIRDDVSYMFTVHTLAVVAAALDGEAGKYESAVSN